MVLSPSSEQSWPTKVFPSTVLFAPLIWNDSIQFVNRRFRMTLPEPFISPISWPPPAPPPSPTTQPDRLPPYESVMLRFSPSTMTLLAKLPIDPMNEIVVLVQLNTIVPPPAAFA